MNGIAALFDTNVILAMVVEGHAHHDASVRSFEAVAPPGVALAAHSLAEAYTTLTRALPRGFGASPQAAMATLDRLLSETTLLGLSPSQTMAAIRAFARIEGRGPRLYDRLIGEVAAVHGIGTIVTWNTRHLAPLFPGLRVRTPSAFLAAVAPGR